LELQYRQPSFAEATDGCLLKISGWYQIYMGCILIPVLKAFNKTSINKGTVKTVEIPIDVNNLAYYDESTSNWQVESGEYMVYIGNSSDNISQKLKFKVK
jgi:hypothetical protein